MPHYFKFENKKRDGDNVFTNEKDFQSKFKSIQQKRPEDFNLILEIKKLFEPSARQFILRHLISLYDIDLGGFKYNLPEKQVILPKLLLNTLNKQIDIIKQNKKNDFGEIVGDIFLGKTMMNIALENTMASNMEIKKNTNKKKKK
jgi:hypothetical protein